MQIKVGYDKLVKLLNLMSVIVSKKGLQEDYKSVNLFVQDNVLQAISTDSTTFCLETLDGEYDLEGETNPFMVFRIKEAMDILSKFSSLQRTVVKEVVLVTQAKGIVMTIVEEPKQDKDNVNFKFSEMYKNQVSKFKLNKADVKAYITRELATMVLPEGAIQMQSRELQKYLEYMYPPMTKPKEAAIMHFTTDSVYSVMGNVYGISMPNTLPTNIFDSMSLSLHELNFLRTVLTDTTTFKVYKDVELKTLTQIGSDGQPIVNKMITLVFQFGATLVKIKTVDMSESVKMSAFKTIGNNSIEIDKPYMLDTLKRLEGYDQVFIEIKIAEDELLNGVSKGTMIVKTQRTKQSIPVNSAIGEGEFNFMLKPENFGLMVFSHLTKDMDGNSDKINDLKFYLHSEPTSKMVDLTCMDASSDWMTKYPRAPKMVAPQLDF